MNITISAGEHLYPEGYIQISNFGSHDPSVSITTSDIRMYVNLIYPPDICLIRD